MLTHTALMVSCAERRVNIPWSRPAMPGRNGDVELTGAGPSIIGNGAATTNGMHDERDYVVEE